MTSRNWFGLVLGLALASTHAQDASLAPIRTQEALQSYLSVTGGKSPLDAFSAGARKRFLSSLNFGTSGLGGFDVVELQSELTDAQIRDVLALFGVADEYRDSLHGVAQYTPQPATESALELAFDDFYFAFDGGLNRQKAAEVLRDSYDQLLAPEQSVERLRHQDDHDLALLYRAADMASWSSHESRYLDDMQRDFRELARRKLDTAGQARDIYDRLIADRRFDDARHWASEHAHVAAHALPPLLDRHGSNATPTVLWIEGTGQRMERRAVDLSTEWRMVVVAGCHFSQDAARDIADDPTLATWFREHALWLAADRESLDNVIEWNRQHADQPMLVSWRGDEWSMLDSWSMPTFYLFHHGKLLARWSGWSHDAGLETLRAQLHKADALPR